VLAPDLIRGLALLDPRIHIKDQQMKYYQYNVYIMERKHKWTLYIGVTNNLGILGPRKAIVFLQKTSLF
jgi:hypothetical protein